MFFIIWSLIKCNKRLGDIVDLAKSGVVFDLVSNGSRNLAGVDPFVCILFPLFMEMKERNK